MKNLHRVRHEFRLQRAQMIASRLPVASAIAPTPGRYDSSADRRVLEGWSTVSSPGWPYTRK